MSCQCPILNLGVCLAVFNETKAKRSVELPDCSQTHQRLPAAIAHFLHASEIPPHPPTTLRDAGSGPAAEGSGAGPTTGRVPAPLSFPALENPDFAVVGARHVANFAFFPAPCGATLLDPPRARACAFGAPSCLCTHPKLVKRSSRLRDCDRSTSAIISVKSRRKP